MASCTVVSTVVNHAHRYARISLSSQDRRERNRLVNEFTRRIEDHRNDSWSILLEEIVYEDDNNTIFKLNGRLKTRKKTNNPIQGLNGIVFTDQNKDNDKSIQLPQIQLKFLFDQISLKKPSQKKSPKLLQRLLRGLPLLLQNLRQ